MERSMNKDLNQQMGFYCQYISKNCMDNSRVSMKENVPSAIDKLNWRQSKKWWNLRR